MCGINGYYSSNLSRFDKVIHQMNTALSHRGPDSNGSWLDENSGIVLGHQRLSILDLSKGGYQPMKSESGRFILTFNGEIYNHLIIRKQLQEVNSNIKWQGSSDTETLLEAIDFWGIEKTLKKIEGMFAFGLWDQKKRSLTIARDRIGEKPLYYGWQGKGSRKVFLFSSELKALKAHPDFDGLIDRDAIALYLRHNYIPAPHSIYKNINKLLPGHYLELNEIDFKKYLLPVSKIYWSLTKNVINGNNNQLLDSEHQIKKDLETNLISSVKKQMISDVPLGAFLSGGIDSSLVVAMMQSLSKNSVKTFTIGFSEKDFSEAEYAKKISKHIGTDHTELYVDTKKAMEVIPKLTAIYDEPFSDSSQIPTYLVSKLAKQHVKVALSGDGGDELFCGYNRYTMSKKFWSVLKFFPENLRKILIYGIHSISPQNWSKIAKFLPVINKYNNFGDKAYKGAGVLTSRNIEELYFKLCSHWQNPSDVVRNSIEPGTFLTEFKPDLRGLDSQQMMMALDSLTYLPDDILVKVDRAAMATSLETRMPFLDHKLIEYAWKIPQSFKLRGNDGKWIIKKILDKYVPKNLTERPKMGFGVPIELWLRGPLKDWAENLLNENRLKEDGYFNPNIIRNTWAEHISGKRNWSYHLWDILMFQSWLDNNK